MRRSVAGEERGNLVWPIVAFAALIIAVGLLFFGSPAPRVTVAIATTGFAGISLEMTFIIAFQVLYGSLYLHLGMLFAAFMIGTAVGSALALRGLLPGGVWGLGHLDAAFVILDPLSTMELQRLASAGAAPVVGPV